MKKIDEIKSRLSIVDVVSQYVNLKKTGRYYKGNCPWHNEKTPSFTVSPDKGIAYCFGCQKGGDMFTFLQLTENIDFPEAFRQLAEKAGVEIDPEQKEIRDSRSRLVALHKEALKFFEDRLQSEEGLIAREYLKKRGLTDKTISEFHLGYAPKSIDGLIKHLKGHGFLESEMTSSGMFIKQQARTEAYYGRFKDRLMFPVHNSSGKVVAFAGRSLDGTEPKYMNSSETKIYVKSNILYNFSRAKQHIHEKDLVIVVEGYMDVIGLSQIGINNVVASCGTALTSQHLTVILRQTSNLALAFDSDTAGIEANKRGIEVALEQGINVSVIEISGGKDPDEIARENPDAFLSMVEKRVSAFDFLLSVTEKKYSSNKYGSFKYGEQKYGSHSIEDKTKISKIMLEFISCFASEIEEEEYLKRLDKHLGISTRALQEEMIKLKAKSLAFQPNDIEKETGLIRLSSERCFIGMLVEFSEDAKVVLKTIKAEDFISSSYRSLLVKLEEWYNSKDDNIDIADLKTTLTREEDEFISKLAMEVQQLYSFKNKDELRNEVIQLHDKIMREKTEGHRRDLIFALRTAMSDNNSEKVNKILSDINELSSN